jgi:hypothetical protein
MRLAAESIGIVVVMGQATDKKRRMAWSLAQAEWLEFTAGTRTLWSAVEKERMRFS